MLASASSKTAYGTAFMLARRARSVERRRPDVAGATPTSCARSAATTASSTYDEVGELAGGGKVAYVDMSGDGALRAARPRALGDELVSDLAGRRARTTTSTDGEADLPGPAPTMFFAPGRVKQRNEDWGAAELQQRIGEAWMRFLDFVTREDGPAVMSITRAQAGRTRSSSTWRSLVAGDARPDEGHVLSMHAA